MRTARAYVLGLAFWILFFFLALHFGAVSGLDSDIIAQLRLPRAILASAVGMGLAVSGAVLQALFTNPLCEPYTLGVSSGSALGAVAGAAIGIPFFVSGLSGFALLGALIFAGILYLVSLRVGSSNYAFLLTGVMLGFMGASLVALFMALSDSNGIQGALVWLLGDLSRARLRGSLATGVAVLGIVTSIWFSWRELDALLMGEEAALSLGVPVTRIRRRMIILTSILIGFCVSGAGMIGFVGLVVPHFARRWVGSLHLKLIPLCAIWGAASLTAADALSRVVARPYELPVGVTTALVGAPVFLWILLSRHEEIL
jgi:iron complex transport system permease protein